MTRRALLVMLALAVADPERLLWVPGRKLISIPKPVGFPRSYPDLVVLESLRARLHPRIFAPWRGRHYDDQLHRVVDRFR